MSTSLLYHAQDLKGIRLSRTEFKEGKTIFHAVVSNGCYRCSKCGSRRVVQSGGVYREFKLVPTGTRKNLIGFLAASGPQRGKDSCGMH